MVGGSIWVTLLNGGVKMSIKRYEKEGKFITEVNFEYLDPFSIIQKIDARAATNQLTGCMNGMFDMDLYASIGSLVK